MNTEIKLRKSQILSAEEEARYFEEYSKAVLDKDKVKIELIQNKLVNANQRLVKSIAGKYLGRGIDLDDLVQEGNMGLLKAIDKFDISLGNKFSTYAVYWIKQAIELALYYQSEAIRIPVYLKKTLSQINKAKSKLTSILEREPSSLEIAEEVNMSVDKVEECLSYILKVTSLDHEIYEDTPMLDMVGSSTSSPEEVYFQKSHVNDLLDLVSNLPYKEQLVITLRFGLDNNPTESLEKIGKRLHVSHERVRQIERNGLKMLRKRINENNMCFTLN